MFRLCHLSDPHLRAEAPETRACLDGLLADALARGADHVVLTGDLVERPGRAHLEALKSVLVARGLWSSRRVTVLPGNHDVAGHPSDPSTPASRRRALTRFLDFFAPVNGPLAPGRPVRKRFGPVELVGLVTASPHHRVEGLVTPADLEAIARRPRREICHRILAIHHHPWPAPAGYVPRYGRILPEGLREGQALIEAAAAGGFTLLLHGHIHAAGGPFDRRLRGIAVRCQGTAKGRRGPDGRLWHGYDLHRFEGARRMLSRRRLPHDALCARALEKAAAPVAGRRRPSARPASTC